MEIMPVISTVSLINMDGREILATEPLSATNWYTEMPSFQAFKDVTKGEYYRRAPDDWHVVITDVKGSTKAIDEGRYKDVNTIGAASISTVQHLLAPDTEFPFVFGGDGATLLISPRDIDRVLENLLKLQRLSEQNFQLGLRVGHIAVGQVHSLSPNHTVEVAKNELTAASGKCVAVFRGGGLTVAEAKIKGEEDKYCVQPTMEMEEASLELCGLSCRWNVIPSKRGKVMSLLVSAREEGGSSDADIYNHVLDELARIYQGELEEANPINTNLITYKSAEENVRDETRFYLNPCCGDMDSRLAEIDFACSIFSSTSLPDWASQYRDSIRPHADHRKFDDMLRMVLDCSVLRKSWITMFGKMVGGRPTMYGK